MVNIWHSRISAVPARNVNVLPTGAWFSLVLVRCAVDVIFHDQEKSLKDILVYACSHTRTHTRGALCVFLRQNWSFATVLLLIWVKDCVCSCFRSWLTTRGRWLRRGKRRKWTTLKRRTRRRTEYLNKGENHGGIILLSVFIFFSGFLESVDEVTG